MRSQLDRPVSLGLVFMSPDFFPYAAQTLEILRNDRGALERALQSAGLSTDSGSLSFNLRSGGNSGQQSGFKQSQGGGLSGDTASSAAQTLDVIPTQHPSTKRHLKVMTNLCGFLCNEGQGLI